MQIKPIANPLPGESLLAVMPTPGPEPDVTWNHRLNLSSGRALSDIALTSEQEERAGRMTLRGQALAPGVIAGLEAGLEQTVNPDATTTSFVLVGAGMGLAASGEIVSVPQALRVHADDLFVYAPVSVLDGGPLPGKGEPVVRGLGGTLAELKAQGRTLPKAGILVLEPIEARDATLTNPADPCPVDPGAEAFANRQRVDGCRLVWYAWPTELLDLPVPGEQPEAGPVPLPVAHPGLPTPRNYRNRIAYALFEYERTMPAGQFWPWLELGLPVGLLVLDDALQPLFVDRYSVTRMGGKARQRTALLPNAGNPQLWQARIQQFAEQISALLAAGQKLDLEHALAFQTNFVFAPPVGLLPTSAVSLSDHTCDFLPFNYALGMRPVPLEQLDVVMRESAPLASLDFSVQAQVELLVPVAQRWYDPKLLQFVTIDAEFDTTIAALTKVRAEWLLRRLTVRQAAARVRQALTGQPVTYPTPDPDALEPDEAVQTDPLDPPETLGDFGVLVKTNEDGTPQKDDAGNPVIQVVELENLRSFLRSGTLTEDEANQLDTLGLTSFIDFLGQRIRQANDTIDFSFLRVQTDIYRVRQRILGVDEAQRLATSSVLATIAKGDSAYATQQDLQAFINGIKTTLPPQAPGDVAPPGAAPQVVMTPQALVAPQNAPAIGVAKSDRFIAGTGAGVFAGGGVNRPITEVTGTSFVATNPSISVVAVGGTGITRPVVTPPIAIINEPGVFTANPATGAVGAISTATGEVAVSQVQGVAVSPDVAAAIRTDTTDVVGRLLDSGTVALRPPTSDAIVEQSPIVGQVYDFRSTVIAERLPEIPSGEVRSAAIATKYTTIAAVQAMPINVGDLQVPGFTQNGAVTSLPLSQIDGTRLKEVLDGVHDPVPQDSRSDALFFNAGVKALENTVGLLRALEGRVAAYRAVLERCRASLGILSGYAAAADRRLQEIGDKLGEARHDVAVAKSLRAEEQARLDRINAKRVSILQNHVPFICYRRPRVALTVLDAPAHVVDAGFAQPFVTACLSSNLATPPEIQRLADLLRRAPLRWFVELPGLLDLLDRQPILWAALQAAKAAAVYRQQQVTPQFALPFLSGFAAQANAAVTPTLGMSMTMSTSALLPGNTATAYYATAAAAQVANGMSRVFQAQEQVVLQQQAQIAAVNLGDFVGLSWQNTRDRARSIVTVGDLIEAAHGNQVVAQRAAQALSDIAHVATCLYAEFSNTPAILRLAWAELLSQYDAPVGLRNLGNLPRWGDVPATRDRREMQSLVDWLFARINPDEPNAVALVNDIVRVCILLASHSPVNQIIAGAIHEPVLVRPGGIIKIAIDPTYVRVGMPVAVYKGPDVVAQAVVSDLSGSLAAAQVTQTTQPTLQIEKGARVQFNMLART